MHFNCARRREHIGTNKMFTIILPSSVELCVCDIGGSVVIIAGAGREDGRGEGNSRQKEGENNLFHCFMNVLSDEFMNL